MQLKQKVIYTCPGCGKPITEYQSYLVFGTTPVHDKKCFSLYQEKKTSVLKKD